MSSSPLTVHCFYHWNLVCCQGWIGAYCWQMTSSSIGKKLIWLFRTSKNYWYYYGLVYCEPFGQLFQSWNHQLSLSHWQSLTFLQKIQKSLMQLQKATNNSEDNTEPCGAPRFTSIFKLFMLYRFHKLLSLKVINHLCATLFTPLQKGWNTQQKLYYHEQRVKEE